ncbi:hypothetical protein LTR49_028657 [Elasticomyces elasticus]|nr:hypothetical protein LTR49_028657 [Elasticomyces elasticus]
MTESADANNTHSGSRLDVLDKGRVDSEAGTLERCSELVRYAIWDPVQVGLLPYVVSDAHRDSVISGFNPGAEAEFPEATTWLERIVADARSLSEETGTSAADTPVPENSKGSASGPSGPAPGLNEHPERPATSWSTDLEQRERDGKRNHARSRAPARRPGHGQSTSVHNPPQQSNQSQAQCSPLQPRICRRKHLSSASGAGRAEYKRERKHDP